MEDHKIVRLFLERDEAAIRFTSEKMLGEAISRFLWTLSREKRVVFMRRYFYLNTVSEISTQLSIGESKVKTMLFRIRNDLRDYLMKEGYTL